MGVLSWESACRIRSQREYQGYSRESFEELTGISARFMYDIETSKRDITTTTLKKICRALNISPHYILFGESKQDEQILYLLGQMNEDQKRLSISLLTAVLNDGK